MFFKQAIPDVVLVMPRRFGDDRGFFQETYRQEEYAEGGIAEQFVQDNHSYSSQRSVIRGLHFQIPPYEQSKLVRCTRGSILDVAVDIRHGSPTFGQFVSAELSRDNGHQLFIPCGFAHGFCTLTTDCEVQYKVSGYYDGPSDRGVAWNDPDIAINWPLGDVSPTLSQKDAEQPFLRDLPVFFNSPIHTKQ